MNERHRFLIRIVHGDGSKMRCETVESATTLPAAARKLNAYRLANRIGPKRIGIFDQKRSRWHQMPLILA